MKRLTHRHVDDLLLTVEPETLRDLDVDNRTATKIKGQGGTLTR